MNKFFNSLDPSRDGEFLDSNWEKTDEVFQRALELDKSNPVIHSQRINMLVPHRKSSLNDTERLERAVAACKEWPLRLAVVPISINSNLAAIYLHTGRLDEAEKLLKKAQDEYPDVSVIGVRLGLVLAIQGKSPTCSSSSKT